jgi:hypothetical protein
LYAQSAPWQQPPSAGQTYRDTAGPQWSPVRPAQAVEPAPQVQVPEPAPNAEDFSVAPEGSPAMVEGNGPGGNCGNGGDGGCDEYEPWNENYECVRGPLCGPCGWWWRPLQNRLWVQNDFLLWWTEGSRVPALLTTSPAGTPQTQAGVLGQPGTSILFGNQLLNEDTRYGGRVTFGYWFDQCNDIGFQASYLGLGGDAQQFQATSNGTPILARPFFDVDSGKATSNLVAFPGVDEGTFAATSTSTFQTVDLLMRRAVCRSCGYSLDLVAGYRFARLDDSLLLTDNLNATSELAAGTNFNAFDSFRTHNEFNGGELGMVIQSHRGRWSLESTLKLALGDTLSQVDINGGTVVTSAEGAKTPYVGGLLALPSNIGIHDSNQFSVIPELGLTLGYDLTCRLRATVGYSFMYWSNVARPGDQIDLNVASSQLPPPTSTTATHPAFDLRTTDYWAQGVNFGLDYRF